MTSLEPDQGGLNRIELMVFDGELWSRALQGFGVSPPNFQAQRFEDPATMLMLGMELSASTFSPTAASGRP